MDEQTDKKKSGRKPTGKAKVFRAFRLPQETLDDIDHLAEKTGGSKPDVVVRAVKLLMQAEVRHEVFKSAPVLLQSVIDTRTAALRALLASHGVKEAR